MSTTEQKTMSVFQIDDSEWWLAFTAEEARASCLKVMGMNPEDITDVRPLTEEELDSLTFVDEQHERNNMAQWRCTCGARPQLDKEWRWDGKAWQHNHGETVGFLRAVHQHKRSFRFQLSRELQRDPATIRSFASANQ